MNLFMLNINLSICNVDNMSWQHLEMMKHSLMPAGDKSNTTSI